MFVSDGREQRTPELLGHGRDPVCRCVGRHIDKNQDSGGVVASDHGHRKTVVAHRVHPYPAVPLSPRSPSPQS